MSIANENMNISPLQKDINIQSSVYKIKLLCVICLVLIKVHCVDKEHKKYALIDNKMLSQTIKEHMIKDGLPHLLHVFGGKYFKGNYVRQYAILT